MFRTIRPALALALCLGSALIAKAAVPAPAIDSLPIAFEANRGQAPSQYDYMFHRDGMRALFLRNEVDFELAGRNGREHPIRLTFLQANAQPKARRLLAGHSNYFIGNQTSRWIRNVPLSAEIDYRDVYPGISLSFYGSGLELEHDFFVRRGADPSQISFRVDGEDGVRLTLSGDLEIESSGSMLRLRKPVAYQDSATGRTLVEATFRLAKDGTVRFNLGKYDNKRPLVIDPVIAFSSYLGGTGADFATAVTTDAGGNILVTGYTSSTDFPTANAEQPTMGGCDPYAGCQNVFITKLDPTGKTLVYSTYLGGSYQDRGDAIAVDAPGNAIVAGYTSSSDFPHAGSIVPPTCSATSQC